jgi:flagellar basal body-associated protein FliL
MADAEIESNAEEVSGSKSGRKKTLVIGGVMLAVMLLEGALVFVLVRQFSGGPQDAVAAAGGVDTEDGTALPEEVEVPIVDFRAQNEKSQRMVIYDLSVTGCVRSDKQEAFAKLVETKEKTIRDRFSAIIRAADPQVFIEPDLGTLKQQFRKALDEIGKGEDYGIVEVLIPNIIPYNS